MKTPLIVSMIVLYLVGLIMMLSASGEALAIFGYLFVHVAAFVNAIALVVFCVGYYEKRKIKWAQAIMIALPILLLIAFRTFIVKS